MYLYINKYIWIYNIYIIKIYMYISLYTACLALLSKMTSASPGIHLADIPTCCTSHFPIFWKKYSHFNIFFFVLPISCRTSSRENPSNIIPKWIAIPKRFTVGGWGERAVLTCTLYTFSNRYNNKWIIKFIVSQWTYYNLL